VSDALKKLAVRVAVDDRDGMKPGAKYYEWEMRGVPIRLEIGPRDVSQGTAVLARRTGGKSPIKLGDIAVGVREGLDSIQRELFERARTRREENSTRNVTRQQLIDLMEGPGGFAYGGYCGSAECEVQIKEATKATVRVLPDEEFRTRPAPAACVWCGKQSVAEAVWAKAY
jgi:prolyl-tRNA synthetase